MLIAGSASITQGNYSVCEKFRYPIVSEDEFLLIFGGQVTRNKTFKENTTGLDINLYDNCELLASQQGELLVDINDTQKACGEEL